MARRVREVLAAVATREDLSMLAEGTQALAQEVNR
jgi:hypothetical protein